VLLSDFFVEFRGAAYNCASSAAVTDYVWLLSVTLLRVYLGRCVGLFCFKLDNAYYAPRNDVSRNMHLSIRTLGDIARKQRQIRLTLYATPLAFFICLIKTDWKEGIFGAGLKFNAERLEFGLS
jgi:hypothetical protein